MGWEELERIVQQGTVEALGKLGRTEQDVEIYHSYKRDEILSKYVSVSDYLMCSVFGCETREALEDGRLYALPWTGDKKVVWRENVGLAGHH